MVRSTLLRLSENKKFGSWVISNGTTRRMARRFVAGETLEEAVAAARSCNDAGMTASLDYLGENVASTSDAQRSRDEYLAIFETIAQENLQANVSCKGSAYTQRTIDLVKRVRARNPAVGTVIQSYLYRSEKDVGELLACGCRIRLCKGAYKEPEDVAFPRKADVDANYIRLMQILLSSGFCHAIATHDPKIIAATIRHAAAKGISKEDFEFQMLYGVRTDLQRRLVKDGYRVRIYIPFGNDWFPYFMRRLAERPANVGFILRNLFRR